LPCVSKRGGMTNSMSSKGIRKATNKKRMKRNRRRRSFVAVVALMTVLGLLFSKGSIDQFFKVFVIEAALVLTLFCLLAVYRSKNGRKAKTSVKSEVYHNVYDRNLYGRTATENNIYTRRKNYNWIIDENVLPKSGGSLTGENLTSGGDIILGDGRADSVEDDIKARVARWSEAVDYSGNVFRKIIENKMKSIEESMEDDGGFEEPKEAERIHEIAQAQELKDIKPEDTVEKAKMPEEFDVNARDIENAEMKETVVDKEDEGIAEDTENAWEEIENMDDSTELKDMNDELECIAEEVGNEELESMKELTELEMQPIGDENRMSETGEFENDDNFEEIKEEIKKAEQSVASSGTAEHVFPPMELLRQPDNRDKSGDRGYSSEIRARKLIETLESFGVGARIINISEGPAVTRYELQPDYGVKVSRIVNLTDDIALNLAAVGVRIEAPIPGKAAIGIEVPNPKVTPVLLREVIESEEFQNHPSKLAFAVGKDIAGKPVVADIAAMPHLLIAGATGSGKSVCINTLITSILYKASPREVRLLMVDPKVVELSIYNGIPHLLIPVVTDPKKAAGALNWAVLEMTNRYKLFAESGVRDLKGYNHLMEREGGEILPQIVIIIDELADLMMVAPNDVEDCICRLAQMARAAGMHLVLATQRPSVNVITGVIKANIPSRISFAVSSQVDSRTILDMAGAEKLLGKGDMLFYPVGMPKPVRVQGALITDSEVENIVSFIKSRQQAQYDDQIISKIDSHADESQPVLEGDDELLPQVIDMIVEYEQASTSLIQRKFKIGYSRAARIMDQLEANGVIGPFEGSKPRKVLITKQQWQEMKYMS